MSYVPSLPPPSPIDAPIAAMARLNRPSRRRTTVTTAVLLAAAAVAYHRCGSRPTLHPALGNAAAVASLAVPPGEALAPPAVATRAEPQIAARRARPSGARWTGRRPAPAVTRASLDPSPVAPPSLPAEPPPSPPPAAAEPDEQPLPADLQRAVLDLVVNGVGAGEVVVVLREEEVLVPLESLRQAGLARLVVDTEPLAGARHVSLRTTAPHVKYVLDTDNLTLELTTATSVLGNETIDLGATTPADLERIDSPSVFANYAPRLIDGTRLEGFGEIGVSTGPMLFLNSASHNPEHDAVRLMSQLIVDEPDAMRRTTLGDQFASAGPLGGGMLMGGLSIASNFALDPYRVNLPRLGYEGSVTTPSTVEVYVNDTLMRRVPVAPGEFALTNLPPVTGSGTTRYVIRDAFGREQSVESSYYASGQVLAPGTSQYQYAAGFARRGFGSESWSYGEPAFLGRHRYGFTDFLTGGARLEGTPSRASAGLDVNLVPGFGELELGVGGSFDTGTDLVFGGAARIGYGFSHGRFAASTAVQATAPQYVTSSLTAEQDRFLAESRTMASVALATGQSLGARVVYAKPRDRSSTAQLGLFWAGRLSRDVTLRVDGNSTSLGSGVWEHMGLATMTIMLPDNHTVSMNRSVGTEEGETTVRVARPVMGPLGVGYQAHAAQGQHDRYGVAAQARTPYGDLGATFDHTDGNSQLVVNGSVGVVFVPGAGLFVGRPVDQSFAVVEVPNAPDARVYLNNQPVGRTDGSGRLLVPNLAAYHGNRLRVDGADVPVDVQIADDERVVAPPFRGGAHVVFTARRVRLVRGRVAFGAGTRWAAYGDLTVSTSAGTFSSALGMHGELELDGVPPGVWTATVVARDGRCTLTLVVPESDRLIQDVGVLRCALPTSGKDRP